MFPSLLVFHAVVIHKQDANFLQPVLLGACLYLFILVLVRMGFHNHHILGLPFMYYEIGFVLLSSW